MPGGVGVSGAGDHVLDSLHVLVALVAVPPILVGQLPRFQRVLLALLEALQLLLLGDVEPELDQDRALVGERALKAVYLVIRAQPLLAGRVLLDPLDEHPPIPRAVEHGHPSPTRQIGPEAPEEVMALLVMGRCRELHDPNVPRIDLGYQPLD